MFVGILYVHWDSRGRLEKLRCIVYIYKCIITEI
jgi:hypothetical protein